MIYYKVAVKEVHDRKQVMSRKKHNVGCPCLADSETVTLTEWQAKGFERCERCFE